MSAREWKPGDVARLLIADEWAVGLAQTPKDERLGPLVWQIGGHSFYKSIAVGNDTLITDVRPLVVVDPEDREQVERLAYHLARIGGDWPNDHGAVRMVLEAMLQPPKPDEPQGLGAVVRDAADALWIRAGRGVAGPDATPWQGVWPASGRFHWREVGAVEVLSEGVQP